MLQQTTTKAVIPYYERFLARFPDLKSLAQSSLNDVLTLWSGLGYYSRARNLHKTSRLLHENEGFPKTYRDLINYPGFGPYTSRAVSSLAFGEAVGVVDGNVIRVICRVLGWELEWWKSKEKEKIQNFVDVWARDHNSSKLNQGLMELGATVCTPKTPSCAICPWVLSCKAYAKNKVLSLPLPKPKRKSEIWIWKAQIIKKDNRVVLVKNKTSPVMKNHWVFPGVFKKAPKKPKTFDLTHSITHHQIYITLSYKKQNNSVKKHALNTDEIWVKTKDVVLKNPSSLMTKILERSANDTKARHRR